MALYLEKPYVDTPISGSATEVHIGSLNYGADFALIQDIPGQVQATNVTCPTDRPEKLRWAITPISDVYRNSGISPNLFTPSRQGASLLCQLTDVYSIKNGEDSSFQAAIPLSGHIVLRMPYSHLVTADEIKTFLMRLVAGLFPPGNNTADALASLIRGSLRPVGL